MPPRPIENPIDNPEASADVLRQVLLRHHHRQTERADHGDARKRKRNRADSASDDDEDENQRRRCRE